MFYQLYFFDRLTGHIDHFREFEAESDASAIAIADRWSDDQAAELWRRDQWLKRWDRTGPDAD